MVSYQIYPGYSQIDAITNDINAEITFTADHDFTDGEIISFRVTKNFGMFEINNKKGRVLSSTSNTVVVDIDTSTWTQFTTAMLNQPGTTPPIAVPSCSGLIPNQVELQQTNIRDAFDNRRI
jgi:hypothetical protein